MTMVVGASGPVVNSPYVNKGITTLATNINLNSYVENIKNKHYKLYKYFTPFQNITNITNRKKTADSVLCVKERKKLLRNVYVPKEGKTIGNVSCAMPQKKNYKIK